MEVTPDALPPERRRKYEANARKSKVLVKPIAPPAEPSRVNLPRSRSGTSLMTGFRMLIDAAVVVAYFVVIIGIGLSQRSKSGSVEGFALGDRQTPWWAVLASIIAAEISAATFLGAPESGFVKGNWTYAQFAIGTILARIIVSFLFIPLFYRHGVISLYEFLETRFGPRTRTWASATFLVTRVLAMGTRLYVSAIILVLAWQLLARDHGRALGEILDLRRRRGARDGCSPRFTPPSAASARSSGRTSSRSVCSSQHSDFRSSSCSARSPAAGAPPLPAHSGTALLELRQTGDRARRCGAWIKNVLTSEYTIWAAVIGSTFVTMATHGIDQDTVQRMLTAKNRRESAKATILSGLVDLPVVGSFILVGILVCDLLQRPTEREPCRKASRPRRLSRISSSPRCPRACAGWSSRASSPPRWVR